MTLEERAKTNFDHPDSLDTDLLIEHIKMLKEHQSVNVPTYDFKTHSRTKEITVEESRDVILVEGILIFDDPKLRELMNVKLFVDTESDLRFIRRLMRDTQDRGRSLPSVVEQYYTTVRPMHMEFVEPTKRYADMIIPEGVNNIAVDMVTALITHILQKKQDEGK